jgi:hypothetical protein
MTIIRRKALEISSWVTWLASPGCKEWAEGLEREVAFIPSDWRALGWAIGSIRVVFDWRKAPLGSLAEAAVEAKKSVKKWRRNSVTVLLYQIFLAPQYVWPLFHPKSFGERIGSALVGLTGIVAGVYTAWEWRRHRQTVEDGVYDDPLASARLYSAELAHRGTAISVQAFTGMCFVLGITLTMESGLRLAFVGVAVLFCLCSILITAQRLRNNRRRIAEVDALVASASEGAV